MDIAVSDMAISKCVNALVAEAVTEGWYDVVVVLNSEGVNECARV